MTIYKKEYSKTDSKIQSKTDSNPRNSRAGTHPLGALSAQLTALAILVLGSVLLAVSCAPVTPAVDEGTGDASAPGVVTDFALDSTSINNTLFTVQWVAPTTTGTKIDGSALELSEIGYRIYYLAGTADQDVPSAESLRQNTATLRQEFTGVTSARITELEPDTRYFVTIASYNTLVTQLAETASDEVIEATTSNVAGGTDDSSAPGAVTGIALDSANTDSTSFVVQWVAPTTTGTKIDGSALSSEELGYRIYYLAGTADQDVPAAESLRQNTATLRQEFTGVTSTRITGLEPDTRYFVTVTSYNTLVPQLAETASDEVIEATTSSMAAANLDGSLVYAETTHEFAVERGGTIAPTETPSIPIADSSGTVISYRLERMDGTDFDSALTVDNSGIITIDSTASTGTAQYLIRAEATGYNTQEVTLTIIIREKFLSYDLTHEFIMGSSNIITQTSNFLPSPRNVTVRYSITESSGAVFDPKPAINENNGIITVGPIGIAGIATYLVQAEVAGYDTQEVTLTITIIENTNAGELQVSTYYSNAGETTDVIPVSLGQALVDDGTFAFAGTDVILTVSNLTNGEHSIHFGSVVGGANSYSVSYQKIVTGNTITILKSELTTGSFSFTDGAVVGISGPNITGTQHLATYRPSNIYSYQDLRAMRMNLDRNYILMKDIVFPALTDSTGMTISNHEAVGDDSTPFTGSFNGANYGIVGVQIEGSDSYQGLFGVIETGSVNVVAAQNLGLTDFKIIGNSHVGSLAGWIKQGTVRGVHVTTIDTDLSKIEVKGDSNSSYGGGLLGRAGTGVGDIQVRIQNTSSAATVGGMGVISDYLGGLVGEVNGDVMLTDSFATGVVSGSDAYIGGLVGYNRLGTVAGYATGSVTGSGDDIGGLIGRNEGLVTGYATGDVTGADSVGGLIGFNSGGTVAGYATGDVTGGSTYAGGLIGLNSGSVTGYATGSVTGGSSVGGLIGFSGSSAVTGYAREGVVSGTENVGGLVGFNDKGTMVGYARSIVRRLSGTDVKFGKTIGTGGGGVATYNSISESQVYDGSTGTTALAGTTGTEGTAVTVDVSTMQSVFMGFAFGTDLGEWTWVADGNWPAINVGDEIKLASDQPIAP